MGLDSYVYRVRKAAYLEDRVYNHGELMAKDLEFFMKSEVDEALVAQLLPYCKEVQVKDRWFDLPAIRKQYNLSENGYVCMRAGSGSIQLCDPDQDNRMIQISAETLDNEFSFDRVDTYCVYVAEEIAYWRKRFDVQDFFYANLENVENTGFYLLDENVTAAYNRKFAEDGLYLPCEKPNEDAALFYHEWY